MWPGPSISPAATPPHQLLSPIHNSRPRPIAVGLLSSFVMMNLHHLMLSTLSFVCLCRSRSSLPWLTRVQLPSSTSFVRWRSSCARFPEGSSSWSSTIPTRRHPPWVLLRLRCNFTILSLFFWFRCLRVQRVAL